MLRIAYCDDNDIQRQYLRESLEEYIRSRAMTAELQEYSSGEEIIRESISGCGRSGESTGTEILILDVIMPGMNGIEVASTLRRLHDDRLIIFLSASMEYAAASYDVDAFYYLTKPLDPMKLWKVLDRAAERCTDGQMFSLRTPKGERQLRVEDIVYISFEDRSLHVHMKDGTVAVSSGFRKPFREAVSQILSRSSGNIRMCGLSSAVNMSYVSDIDDGMISLREGSLLPVSRSASAGFRIEWKNWQVVT